MIEEILNLKDSKSLEKYIFSKKVYQSKIKEITNNFIKKSQTSTLNLSEIGIDALLPFQKVGKNGSTFDLLAIEDLELFNLYKKIASNGNILVDIGANIGLHSLIWNKYGGISHGYEPDPSTFKKGIELFKLNNLNLKEAEKDNIKVLSEKNLYYYNTAIGNDEQKNFEEFVRFRDNPTGNHLMGRKNNLYGNYEVIKVPIVNINSISRDVNYIKIDAEGADLEILSQILSLKKSIFKKLNSIYLCDWRDTNAAGMLNLASKNNLKIYHGLTTFEVTDAKSMYKEHRHSFATIYFD